MEDRIKTLACARKAIGPDALTPEQNLLGRVSYFEFRVIFL